MIRKVKSGLMCAVCLILAIGVILSIFTMSNNINIVIRDNFYYKILLAIIPSLCSVALTYIVTRHFNRITSDFQESLVKRSENHTKMVEKRKYYYKMYGLRYYINNKEKSDKHVFNEEINKIPAVFSDDMNVLDAYKEVTNNGSNDPSIKTEKIIDLYQEMFKVVEPGQKFDRNTMKLFIYLT